MKGGKGGKGREGKGREGKGVEKGRGGLVLLVLLVLY